MVCCQTVKLMHPSKLIMHPYLIKMELPISIIEQERPVGWAKDHCVQDFTYNTFKTQGNRLCYLFYFADQQDAALFALRWA
jgi:hypothetical protein